MPEPPKPGCFPARSPFRVAISASDSWMWPQGVTETRWQYAQILAIAETKRYFILALSKNHAQAVDKEGMQGGSAEEFRAFITEKTGKPVTYIKK
jgi:hypothetical protein